MAPSPCRPAIANMTEIAPVLDRRSSFELAGAKTVLGNIPGGAAILGRHEISAVEDRHRTIDRALAPTGHTGQRRLGGTAEGNTVGRRQRAGQARDQNFRIDVVGEGHGRGSWLARPLIPRDAGRLLQMPCCMKRPRRVCPLCEAFLRRERESRQAIACRSLRDMRRRAMLATRPARKACHAPAPERRPYHSRHSPQAAATTAGTRSARGENLAPDYRVLTG